MQWYHCGTVCQRRFITWDATPLTLHGHDVRHSTQPGDEKVLHSISGRRKTQEDCLNGMYAKNDDGFKCHDPRWEGMARGIN